MHLPQSRTTACIEHAIAFLRQMHTSCVHTTLTFMYVTLFQMVGGNLCSTCKNILLHNKHFVNLKKTPVSIVHYTMRSHTMLI